MNFMLNITSFGVVLLVFYAKLNGILLIWSFFKLRVDVWVSFSQFWGEGKVDCSLIYVVCSLFDVDKVRFSFSNGMLKKKMRLVCLAWVQISGVFISRFFSSFFSIYTDWQRTINKTFFDNFVNAIVFHTLHCCK